MTGLHLHLILNHLPIVGAFLAIPLLLVSLIWIRERGLVLASIAVVLFTAAGAVVATETGEEAEELIEALPWADQDAIHVHEERAEASMIVALVTGVLSIAAGVAAFRGSPAVARAAVGATLLGTSVTAGLMAWTGLAGGEIRHDELLPGAVVEAPDGARPPG